MMKTSLIFLFIFGLNSIGMAQNPDQALARVHYKFSHIRDTTQRNAPYQENMMLIIGKNASLYTSYDKMLQADRLAVFLKEQTKANGGTLNNIVMQKGLMRPITSIDFYSYATEHKSFTIEPMMMAKYMIPAELNTVNWSIKPDTMSFSGISCRKATTHFKGRNWIAWYAIDLPFQSGPWQLNGLPGLIVSAYDEKKEVQFEFDGLENINDTNIVTKDDMIALGTGKVNFSNNFYLGKEIKLPADAIKVTREEITRLRQAISDNARVGTENGQITAAGRVIKKGNTTTSAIKNNLNNPIELPEK